MPVTLRENLKKIRGYHGHLPLCGRFERFNLTFWCLPRIVVAIVKTTTVHPALCDPCNYSLPHLSPEKSMNREIEIQHRQESISEDRGALPI